MTPKNTDAARNRERRRNAWQSAVISTGWLMLASAGILYARSRFVPEGFWRTVLLIIAVLDLGSIVPIWILLRERLKEIEGGEEDAAAQY